MSEESNQPQPSSPEERTDITLDFHPSCLEGRMYGLDKSENPIGKKAHAAAHDALNVAYQVHASINDTEKALKAMAPPNAPVYRAANGAIVKEYGAEEQLAKAAEQATARALATLNRRGNELVTYADTLRNSVAIALRCDGANSPAGIAVASEIRAHVRGLDDSKRTSFLHGAIEGLDIETVNVVLNSPPYLLGIDAKEQARLREHAASKFAPVESKLLAGVEKAIAKVQAGAQSLVKRTNEVTSVAANRSARRAEALAKLTGAK